MIRLCLGVVAALLVAGSARAQAPRLVASPAVEQQLTQLGWNGRYSDVDCAQSRDAMVVPPPAPPAADPSAPVAQVAIVSEGGKPVGMHLTGAKVMNGNAAVELDIVMRRQGDGFQPWQAVARTTAPQDVAANPMFPNGLKAGQTVEVHVVTDGQLMDRTGKPQGPAPLLKRCP